MRTVPALRLAAAMGVALGLSAAAHAAQYSWTFTKNQPGTNYGVNNNGGTIEGIFSSFDSATKRLTFDVAFSGANGAVSPLVTNGFWLVLDNGPNPKNNPGELAIFYFDASKVFAGQAATPTMTVYEYNGRNDNSSWNNGNGNATPNEANDFNGLIKGKNEAASFINSISAADQVINGQTYRRLSFDINASAIMNRIPSYPTPGTDWYGTGFDNKLGIWFHPAQIFNATYESGSRGKITSLSIGGEGWLDGDNFMTVPAPASAALLGLGGLVAARRRRTA
jgi:hypothetical protein